MDGLSFSSWIILILGFVICFGGAFYCLLIIWGKEPERLFDVLGVSRLMSLIDENVVNAGIYAPFEYMERGPKEKGIGVGVLFLLLMVGWGFGIFEAESEGAFHDVDYDVELHEKSLDPISGHSGENTVEYRNISVEEVAITNITFTLTWQDEPDQTGFENDGDEFSLNVTTPWGDTDETPMTKNQHGEEGVVSLTFGAPGVYPDSGSAGYYDVNITMGEAGEQWPIIIGPSVGFTDDGNDWTLTVEYSYYKKVL